MQSGRDMNSEISQKKNNIENQVSLNIFWNVELSEEIMVIKMCLCYANIYSMCDRDCIFGNIKTTFS